MTSQRTRTCAGFLRLTDGWLMATMSPQELRRLRYLARAIPPFGDEIRLTQEASVTLTFSELYEGPELPAGSLPPVTWPQVEAQVLRRNEFAVHLRVPDPYTPGDTTVYFPFSLLSRKGGL